MRRPSVYLDHFASTPPRPEAIAAMIGACEPAGNPSSVHAHGRAARRRLEDARSTLAAWAGTTAERIVLTSGATEANAMVLSGFPELRTIVSAIEHDSVLANAAGAERVAVDRFGRADLEDLERRLAAGGPALVSLMAVNNETGVIQPVAEAARMVRTFGGRLHVDAAQAGGRIALAELDADLVTLSAHKLGGPVGIGALVLGDGVEPRPLVRGGGQERRRRAGTENVPAAVAFAAAVAGLDAGLDQRLALWRDALEDELLTAVPDLIVFGRGAPRAGAVTCLSLPGASAESQVMALDLAGYSVGAGAACSSGRVRPSHVLAAMGADPQSAASAIRVSLGWTTTWDDVAGFAVAWRSTAGRLRGGRAA